MNDHKVQTGSVMKCSNCGTQATHAFTTFDTNRRISADSFHYYSCHSCGLLFLGNVPGDLGSYYPTSYYANNQTTEQLASNAKLESYKIDIVTQFVKSGSLCEIGPGGGGFVWLAKAVGFEVTAIEMDSAVCEFLSKTVGIRVINSSDVPDALTKLPKFDVIALWHVIEHIPDPWPIFRAAAERMNPGAILLIAAPNPASFQFWLLKGRWTHIDAPRHTTLIPMELLARRAKEFGLEQVLMTTNDEGSLGWNRFGWQNSLGNLWPHPLFKRLMIHLGRIVTLAVSPLERRKMCGSTYTAVFRKPD